MSPGGSGQWSGSGGQPGGASGATGGTGAAGNAAGAAGVAGCGVAGQPSAEDFKALLIERVCEAYGPRCQEEQRPFDPAFCRSYLAQQHELLFGAGVYDAARAAQCLVSCPTSLEACGWVYLLNGTTPLGGACRGQTDCAPSPLGPVACIEPQLQISTYARTCQRVALGEGEDCKSNLLSFFPWILACAEGLHCDQQCTPKLLNGEKCSSGWFCASGFCPSGKCVAGDLEGDSCLGTTCSAVDLWCDEDVCVRRRPGGSPCTADLECQSRSCVGGLCWSEVGEACAAGALQPAEQFERERIHLECQHHAGCCDQNGSLFSQRWCELHRAYWPFQSPETDGKRIPLAQNFNPAAVDACLTQVAQSVECLTSINVLKLPPTEFISPPEDPDPCEAVYRAVPGALPGEPCASRWDCAQPASGTVECYKGSCVQVIVGKPGEPCLPEGAILHFCRKKDGLWCSEEGICQPLPAVGESCQWPVSCAAPAICAGEVCVEPKVNGEPCSPQQVCPGGRCEQGACKPLRGNGEACEDASDCTSNHCVNQVCRLVTAPYYVCGPLRRARERRKKRDE